MSSSQPRDYRRILYRLDKATRYESVPALVQHMMNETLLDGILELRLITSSGVPGQSGEPPKLHLPSTFISFRREGREVNAVALYGPRASSFPPSTAAGDVSTRHSRPDLPGISDFSLEVKKRFAPRTTLVWVFSPLVQKLLNEGASTILFECRSYLAGSDVAREVRAADAAAEAEAVRRAPRERRSPPQPQQPEAYQDYYSNTQQQPLQQMYQQQSQQQMYQQQSQQQMHQQQQHAQYSTYDDTMFQWHQVPFNSQQTQPSYSGFVASSLSSNATYYSADAMYLAGYGSPVASSSEQYYLSAAPAEQMNVPPRTNNVQRSPPPAQISRDQPRAHKSTPSPPRVHKDEDPAMELLTRRAPFKRMLGYAGKQHDGSVAVYELVDEVAAIAFNDSVPGMGIAGVEAMGNIGRGTRLAGTSANARIY